MARCHVFVIKNHIIIVGTTKTYRQAFTNGVVRLRQCGSIFSTKWRAHLPSPAPLVSGRDLYRALMGLLIPFRNKRDAVGHFDGTRHVHRDGFANFFA